MKKIEEIEFEIHAKRNQIKKFLTKPTTERMPFEAIELAQILKKVYVFQRHFNTNSQDFINLTLVADLIDLQENVVLYEQYDGTDYIYLIIEGCILLKKSNIEIKLGPGQIIGQLEMLLRIPNRESKAVSSIATSCLRLPKSAIQMNLHNQHEIRQFSHFVSISSYFETLTPFQRDLLVTRIQKCRFIHGEKLMKAGDVVNHILWIARGAVAVVKLIQVLESNTQKTIPFHIDTLQQGQTFGEQQSIFSKKCLVNLICDKPGCYYKLNTNEINNLTASIKELLIKNSKEYPSDDQILYIYGNQIKLNLEKNRKLFQLLNDKNLELEYHRIKKQELKFGRLKKIVKDPILRNLYI